MIQILVDVFKASAERDDLEELFRKVCFTGAKRTTATAMKGHSHFLSVGRLTQTQVQYRFEDLPIGKNWRQMPTKDRCSLTKRFYFYPGLPLL